MYVYKLSVLKDSLLLKHCSVIVHVNRQKYSKKNVSIEIECRYSI